MRIALHVADGQIRVEGELDPISRVRVLDLGRSSQ